MSKSSRNLNLPVLALPHDHRRDLGLPHGKLLVHPERGPIVNLRVDVTVGDIVSERHVSRVKVIDYKTKRFSKLEMYKDERCLYVVNPPGSISLSSITVINSITHGLICVLGEEDMLSIPFLLRESLKVAYGQPDVGVVILRSSREIALKVFKILKPAMVVYKVNS